MEKSSIFFFFVLFACGFDQSSTQWYNAYPFPLPVDDLSVPVVSPEWCPEEQPCSGDYSEGSEIYPLVGCCCATYGPQTDFYKFRCEDGEWVEDQSDNRFRCPQFCRYEMTD